MPVRGLHIPGKTGILTCAGKQKASSLLEAFDLLLFFPIKKETSCFSKRRTLFKMGPF